MRTLKLKADTGVMLYTILLKGNEGKGYSVEGLKKMLPTFEAFEKIISNKSTSSGGIFYSCPQDATIEVDVTEDIFDLIKDMVKKSFGWSGEMSNRVVIVLEAYLNDIPSWRHDFNEPSTSPTLSPS